MIDQAINEVFQREKKVFVPDFGAFIYSEGTETIDFNAHLNFDDGKVISEIQEEKNQESEPAIISHLDNRIEAMEKDKKRIKDMFPDIKEEEWNGNPN